MYHTYTKIKLHKFSTLTSINILDEQWSSHICAQ